jgi:hypothetical protein
MMNDETTILLHKARKEAQKVTRDYEGAILEFFDLWRGVDNVQRVIEIMRFEAENMPDPEAARKKRREALREQRLQFLRLKRLALLYGSFPDLAQLEEDYYQLVRRLIN